MSDKIPIAVVMQNLKEQRETIRSLLKDGADDPTNQTLQFAYGIESSVRTIESAIAEYLLIERSEDAIRDIIKELREMVDGEAGS